MWLTHYDHQLNAVHDFNLCSYIWSTRSREF